MQTALSVKYSPGDDLFWVNYALKQKDHPCKICEGGKLQIESDHSRDVEYAAVMIKGKLFICPECTGRSYYTTSTNEFEIEEVRVHKVHITLEQGRSEPIVYYDIGRERRGGAVTEHQLYVSKVEAEEEIARRLEAVAKHRRANNMRPLE